MRIKNRNYPYPVLKTGNDSYVNSKFNSNVSHIRCGHNINFNIETELCDEILQKMIESGSAKYAHHVECPQTCFRTVELTDKSSFSFVIHESKLRGLVQLCTFIVAAEDIVSYSNPAFNEEYRVYSFDIDKGCFLAIGEQYNFTINKDDKDISNVASIFVIGKNYDHSATDILLDTTGQKVFISIPEKTYGQYSALNNNVFLLPVIHSIVILPALMQVLSELKEAANTDEFHMYRDLRWYRALQNTAKKLKIGFDQPAICKIDIFKAAQQFLDAPAIKAMDNLYKGDGDDDEN